MPRKKYLDFEEGNSEKRPSKLPPYESRSYRSLTCPHCNVIFVSLPVENINHQKAGECLKHLRGCSEFKAKGGTVSKAPKKSNELEELKQKVAQLEAASAEDRHAILKIAHERGLGEPYPTKNSELVVVIEKRKRDEELSTYHGWTAKEEKGMRALVHPDKDAQHSEAFNKWRTHVRTDMLEAGKR